ncbi:MAG: hypothetical protein QM658_11615, partial [Gordonia sp. (in: high G+C Gram-positive bacteria)]
SRPIARSAPVKRAKSWISGPTASAKITVPTPTAPPSTTTEISARYRVPVVDETMVELGLDCAVPPPLAALAPPVRSSSSSRRRTHWTTSTTSRRPGSTTAAAAGALGVRLMPGTSFAPVGRFDGHLRIPFVLPPEELRRGVELVGEAYALASGGSRPISATPDRLVV